MDSMAQFADKLRMSLGSRPFFVSFALALVLAFGFGWSLQPQAPNLTGDHGYQGQATAYRAGGPSCDPMKIRALPAGQRERKADDCAEAEEQHRVTTDGLIETRRAAAAAETSALAAAAQARIEAWGAAIGLLTLFAAVAAAIFAKKAADHTEGSARAGKRAANAAEESLEISKGVANAELRPWVTIDVRPISFSCSDARMKLDFEVSFKNIGQTAARRFNRNYNMRFVKPSNTAHREVDAVWAGWKNEDASKRALMPGEAHAAPGSVTHKLESIPWSDEAAARANALAIVIVSAWYWSDIDEGWHRTDRSFTFGGGDDPFEDMYLFRDVRGEWTGEELGRRFVMAPYLAGETT